MDDWRIVDESDELVELSISESMWLEPGGLMSFTEDYVIKGERWQVHKSDADDQPSRPHAHCVEGKHRGLKLHLGTGELFRGSQRTGKTLHPKQFARLLVEIAPKFPHLTFPLQASQ